jgi:hypothetical protein
MTAILSHKSRLADRGEEVEDFRLHGGVKRARRLVEEQYLRLERDGPRDRHVFADNSGMSQALRQAVVLCGAVSELSTL